MILCPFCGSTTRVYDVRQENRKRRCEKNAEHTFNTVEVVAGSRAANSRGTKSAPLGPVQQEIVTRLDGALLSAVDLMAVMETNSKSRIGDALRGLRQRKLVRIAGYQMVGRTVGRWSPLYTLGSAPDAPEPRRDSAAITRRYRANKAAKKLGPWSGLLLEKP